MAKGNLFQGMARGKVGDVVFSRLNGQQISRVRNRSPRNPNTNKQMVQRAVMANIMAMYSAGQAIFNHAFQGKAVGAENQREFMKSNVNLLRSLVISEMNAGTAAADCKGHVGARGMNIASPFEGAIISKGTYDQSVFTFENGGFKLPTVNANETIGAYAARIGLVPGDLYTFVAYGVGFDDVMANLNVEQESASGNTDRLYNCRFEYVQFKVKENILAITTAITAATVITDLFDDYQHSGEPFADEFLLTETIDVQDIMSYADAGCIGCIRSREYEDLRSNSFLHVSTGKWGFTTPYLLSVWDETTTLQGTTLILEGSNFSHAGGSALPTPGITRAQIGGADWPENDSSDIYDESVAIDVTIDRDAPEDGWIVPGIIVQTRASQGESWGAWIDHHIEVGAADDNYATLTLTPSVVGADIFEVRLMRDGVQQFGTVMMEKDA